VYRLNKEDGMNLDDFVEEITQKNRDIYKEAESELEKEGEVVVFHEPAWTGW
jgi:hypothetical protein